MLWLETQAVDYDQKGLVILSMVLRSASGICWITIRGTLGHDLIMLTCKGEELAGWMFQHAWGCELRTRRLRLQDHCLPFTGDALCEMKDPLAQLLRASPVVLSM